MKSYDKFLALAVVAAATAFAPRATATSIIGTVDFGGNVTISTVSGNGFLQWDDVAGQSYTFTVTGSTGDFIPIDGGGNEVNIGAVGETGPPSFTAAPIDTPVDIPDFLTFLDPAFSGDSFTLTDVVGGIDGTAGCSANPAAAAAGNFCSPAGSPYNLEDLSTSTSSASFQVKGYIVNGGTDTPATIVFTASDVSESFEQILDDQENGTADVITYGAQLISGTPEPPTSLSLMLGTALLLAGSIFRHRRTH